MMGDHARKNFAVGAIASNGNQFRHETREKTRNARAHLLLFHSCLRRDACGREPEAMSVPAESNLGRPLEISPRCRNSSPSGREVQMLTALEDKAATKHAPRSPDRDVGSDDESMYSVGSHGARLGPYTPERCAPPSYDHVMISPMPREPPSTPPRRLGQHCSYSGEGEHMGDRVLTLFLVLLHPSRCTRTRPRDRSRDSPRVFLPY